MTNPLNYVEHIDCSSYAADTWKFAIKDYSIWGFILGFPKFLGNFHTLLVDSKCGSMLSKGS